jgi:hypothetical protein
MGAVAGAIDYQSRIYKMEDHRAVEIFKILKKKAQHDE